MVKCKSGRHVTQGYRGVRTVTNNGRPEQTKTPKRQQQKLSLVGLTTGPWPQGHSSRTLLPRISWLRVLCRPLSSLFPVFDWSRPQVEFGLRYPRDLTLTWALSRDDTPSPTGHHRSTVDQEQEPDGTHALCRGTTSPKTTRFPLIKVLTVDTQQPVMFDDGPHLYRRSIHLDSTRTVIDDVPR